MFYENFPDCQLTNKQIAKHLKYINNKKENDVQYLKIKKCCISKWDKKIKTLMNMVLKEIKKINNGHHKPSSIQILKRLKYTNNTPKIRSIKNKIKWVMNVIVQNEMFSSSLMRR